MDTLPHEWNKRTAILHWSRYQRQAGRAGRLGNAPPTFGTDPGLVIGIMAGGDAALRTGIEEIEDQAEQGKADLRCYHISALDTVVGISASAPPLMWQALCKKHGKLELLPSPYPIPPIPELPKQPISPSFPLSARKPLWGAPA